MPDSCHFRKLYSGHQHRWYPVYESRDYHSDPPCHSSQTSFVIGRICTPLCSVMKLIVDISWGHYHPCFGCLPWDHVFTFLRASSPARPLACIKEDEKECSVRWSWSYCWVLHLLHCAHVGEFSHNQHPQQYELWSCITSLMSFGLRIIFLLCGSDWIMRCLN